MLGEVLDKEESGAEREEEDNYPPVCGGKSEKM
jgi:hypothetical protein